MSKCGDAQTHEHIRATLVESGIMGEIKAWVHRALGRGQAPLAVENVTAEQMSSFGLHLPIRRDEHTQVYIQAILVSSGSIREIRICLRREVAVGQEY